MRRQKPQSQQPAGVARLSGHTSVLLLPGFPERFLRLAARERVAVDVYAWAVVIYVVHDVGPAKTPEAVALVICVGEPRAGDKGG